MITLRTKKDPRRLSFPKTFGSTTELVDIDLDLNLSNFNQHFPSAIDPALPNACTAFSRADTATNEDRIIYDPQFTYEKACFLENVPIGSPLTLESAYKSARTDGLKAVGEPEGMELSHRRGPYFEVHPVKGQDWFDALWSALIKGKRPISLGTMWYPEMTAARVIDGIAIRPTSDGHAYEVCGVQTTDKPRMKVKWWGGEVKWFGREAVNALMNAQGSDNLTDVDGKATPEDLKSIGFIYLLKQDLLMFLKRLFDVERANGGTLYEDFETQIQRIQKEINQLHMNPDTITYPWDSPSHNYHNTRVLCDKAGLTLEEKNLICSCIYQESEFYNYKEDGTPVEDKNLNKDGSLSSTDWGIVQVNDWFHIAPHGTPFASVAYVLANPDVTVKWMIKMYQGGQLGQWSSYKFGKNRPWLLPNSPMWQLGTTPQ